jgi:hypothetical protein
VYKPLPPGVYPIAVDKYININNIREADVKLHSFLTSALDGGEWSTSGSSCLTPGIEPVTPLNKWAPEPFCIVL